MLHIREKNRKTYCSTAAIVPDRTHSYSHTALSEISNRIVGKILLHTIWYHTLFNSSSDGGVYRAVWCGDKVRRANNATATASMIHDPGLNTCVSALGLSCLVLYIIIWHLLESLLANFWMSFLPFFLSFFKNHDHEPFHHDYSTQSYWT